MKHRTRHHVSIGCFEDEESSFSNVLEVNSASKHCTPPRGSKRALRRANEALQKTLSVDRLVLNLSSVRERLRRKRDIISVPEKSVRWLRHSRVLL